MKIKMLSTQRGKNSLTGRVESYQAGETYDVACSALADAFLGANFAEEVSEDFDPEEVTAETNFAALTVAELTQLAKLHNIEVPKGARKTDLVGLIANAVVPADVFDPESVDVDTDFAALTIDELLQIASKFGIKVESDANKDTIIETIKTGLL
jgi:hypothetical protein